MALVVIAIVLVVMRYTRLGLIARATMQNPGMSAALGINPDRVYMLTFAAGAALTGLAGGLIAPVSGITPGMGAAYVAKAFITVVGGLGTLIGPVIGAVLIEYIVSSIGSQQVVNANLVLGAVFLLFVLLLRRGLVPSLQLVVVELWHRARRRAPRPKADPAAAATPAGSK